MFKIAFVVKAKAHVIVAAEILNSAVFTFSTLVDDNNKSQSC